MPTYAETAQTIYVMDIMLKGFFAFIGIILLSYGIYWIVDKIRGRYGK